MEYQDKLRKVDQNLLAILKKFTKNDDLLGGEDKRLSEKQLIDFLSQKNFLGDVKKTRSFVVERINQLENKGFIKRDIKEKVEIFSITKKGVKRLDNLDKIDS